MNVVRIPEAIGFEARMRDLLRAREAENHLMLGILEILISSPPRPDERRHFWTVDDGTHTVGGAFWTPPFKPVMTRMEERVLSALFERMTEGPDALNGISGPAGVAGLFAERWRSGRAGPCRKIMDMRIRELTRVNETPMPPGRFRGAMTGDLPWFLEHARVFHESIGLDEPVDVEKEVGEYVRDHRLFLWEKDGIPVSMAGWTGPTPSGARLNLVFTPGDLRGRGYSRACVSGLCRWLLAQGRKTCFLFSDAGNPFSNRVYDRVGFTDVCDWELYEFGTPTPPMG